MTSRKSRAAAIVQTEIRALQAAKAYVPQAHWFGDDNHAAIDAQIAVLRNKLTSSQIKQAYGRNGHLWVKASQARDWLWLATEQAPSSLWAVKYPKVLLADGAMGSALDSGSRGCWFNSNSASNNPECALEKRVPPAPRRMGVINGTAGMAFGEMAGQRGESMKCG